DPDITHTIDPATETLGGNLVFDNNRNFHSAWDAPPSGLDVAHALDLLPLAQQVARDTDRVENWSFAWATDTRPMRPIPPRATPSSVNRWQRPGLGLPVPGIFCLSVGERPAHCADNIGFSVRPGSAPGSGTAGISRREGA